MTGHAKLSPSSAHRWMACPGSVALCDGLADVSSKHAELGTFAHDVAADCLECDTDAATWVNGKADNPCTEEMAGYVQEYLDEVRAYMFGGASLFVEQRVDVCESVGEVYGTADAIVLSGDGKSLDVFDFKYGAGVFVGVEDNPQLWVYGLGALETLPRKDGEESNRCDDVEVVTVHIVQPRHHQGGHHWQDIPVGKLRAWGEKTLRDAVDATSIASAPLVAGEHCRWCLAKPTCPQLRRAALEHTRHLFEDEDLAVPAKTPPAPESLTPEQIAAALAAFPVIEQWLKAVREHAYDLASAGAIPPGYKLVGKRSIRQWKDEAATVLALEAFLPAGSAIYAPLKVLSPAQAEKLLPKGEREIIAQLTHKPKSGTTLVPASDKRPAVTPGDVFGELSPCD